MPTALALVSTLAFSAASGRPVAVTGQSVVATVHPLATEAGIEAFGRGGNAVDAALAAALMLGVVDGHNSGIGGGGFLLIRLSDGRLVAIDGRETAPRAATPAMFFEGGQPQPERSRVGALACGVPGALAAYDYAARRFGRLALADHLRRAATRAEKGFPLDAPYAGKLRRTAGQLALFPGTRAVLLKPDGSPYREGQTLRQPDLARTYRQIAQHGIDWFYRGPFAREVARWMADHGGLITAEDLAAYQTRTRQPVTTTYRGYTVVGFPPPSSGGVHVAEILNILEHFDLKTLYQTDRAAFYHVMAEAMKRAFADRAHWLGDPDFTPVPRGLVDKQYAAELARQIDPARAVPVSSHGQPPRWPDDSFGHHTTHVAAADTEGNWVALTATVNTTFGSRIIVPGTGVVLNSEMDDFSIAPGVPNVFGLVGAEANAVAPGKRPLSSMSPTIVLKDGRPVLTLGAAGGPKIITQVVLGIVYHLDLGLTLPEALAAPRIHHQWQPDQLLVEKTLDPAIASSLRQRGHDVRRTASAGVMQAIGRRPDGQRLIGVHDPRVPGKAAGIPKAGPLTGRREPPGPGP